MALGPSISLAFRLKRLAGVIWQIAENLDDRSQISGPDGVAFNLASHLPSSGAKTAMGGAIAISCWNHGLLWPGNRPGIRFVMRIQTCARIMFSGVPRSRNALSLGRRNLSVTWHRRHRLEHAVSSDERMEERRREMQQDHGKEQERQIEVRVPEQRVKTVARRQDRRKAHAAVDHDRIGGGRQHGPTDQR